VIAGVELGAPWALLLGLPVAALPLRRFWQRRARVGVPGFGAVSAPATIRTRLAPLPLLLHTLGLLLCVAALARPRLVRTDVVVETPGLDILMVLDTSGSMDETDMRTGALAVSRLDAAKAVIKEFVAARPHDRVGVVAFGEEAFTYVPLTLDHVAVRDALGDLSAGVAGGRGTAIGTGIAVAAKRMRALQAPERILILLTDGQNTAGSVAPLDAATAAAALGIRVYTIGVGAESRGLLGLFRQDGVDEDTLRGIADKTGGRFYRARDVSALRDVYAAIDGLEPTTAEVRQFIDFVELFRWPLVPGTLLLGLGALVGGTWLRRGP
jgi:Ca-activated chloride channel family protein